MKTRGAHDWARWAMICGLGLAAASAAPPDTLALSDLVNRADRWPDSVSLVGDFRFGNGVVLHPTDKLRVVHFDGAHVVVVAANGMRLNLKPEDCGLLAASNQAWAALTPAQRAIGPDTLASDLSLWPTRVAVTTAITCNFGRLNPGTEVGLLNVSAKGPNLAWPNSPNRVSVDFDSTDIFARARQLALLDPDQRPSRIAAALRGIMVDAAGRPYQDEHLGDKKLFAFYFGANWCAPCHAFSPDFVKFAAETMPAHPELAVVLLSNDPQPAQMLAYMQEEKMPFPAVAQKDLLQSSLLSSYAAQMIPHLIIVNRFGKVLATNDDPSGNRADPKDTIGALDQLLKAPANSL